MYKIIYQDQVIDAIAKPRFIKFLPSGHIAITDKSNAQGIATPDGKTIYSFSNIKPSIKVIKIQEISVEEFSRLQDLLNSNQTISADESALAVAKNTALKHLSAVCKTQITAGFSIKLSDGLVYNFKLTTEDQLNLMALENQLNAGVANFIYHATNQPCRFFNREDMSKILNTFRSFVLYHTTYFNAVKQYINSLVDIEKVKLFTYGTDVSDTVNDVVIKQILKNGGNFN